MAKQFIPTNYVPISNFAKKYNRDVNRYLILNKNELENLVPNEKVFYSRGEEKYCHPRVINHFVEWCEAHIRQEDLDDVGTLIRKAKALLKNITPDPKPPIEVLPPLENNQTPPNSKYVSSKEGMILKEWNGKKIHIREDRYVCATDMPKATGKKIDNFLKSQETQEYLFILAKRCNSSQSNYWCSNSNFKND
jgi:hypothetical protein